MLQNTGHHPIFRNWIPLGLLLVFFAVPRQASGCLCFSRPLCGEIRTPGEQRAVFVGTVSEIYPDLDGAMDVGRAERGGMTLQEAKNLLQERWQGVLSAKEILAVQQSSSMNELLLSSSRIALATRRVRFRVVEWLRGGSGSSFDLFTDLSSCGYRFTGDSTYLVVATLNAGSQRWQTGACMRNAPVDSRLAQEDLKALRAARAGRSMLLRVYGQVLDWREIPDGIQLASGPPRPVLTLTGPATSRQAAADEQGWFTFDDLPRGKYRLELRQPPLRGQGTTIDVRRTACSEASVFLESGVKGDTFKVLVSTGGELPPPSATPKRCHR